MEISRQPVRGGQPEVKRRLPIRPIDGMGVARTVNHQNEHTRLKPSPDGVNVEIDSTPEPQEVALVFEG